MVLAALRIYPFSSRSGSAENSFAVDGDTSIA